MKIGIFTDPHYSSQTVTCSIRYNSKSLEKIQKAYDYFEKENCDLVVCLGDLIDKEDSHQKEIENLKAVAKVINHSRLDTICLMGNHDAFCFDQDEFYKILNLSMPDTINAKGKTLLFLDACYFKNGKHYQPGDSDWTDTCYPHTQKLWQQLCECSSEVYVFIHQNLDPAIPENHRLHNFAQINDLLKKSGKVKAVYQGHYHHGEKSKQENIDYVAFPAMCQNRDAVYILDI